MSMLSAERCVACRRDSPRVTEAEIAELRREVSAWQLLERDGGERAQPRLKIHNAGLRTRTSFLFLFCRRPA